MVEIVRIKVIKDEEDQYRYEWSTYHPLLISEAFFAVGTVLSFIRLTFLFRAVSWLGPLQISFKKMMTDIVRFLIIFVVVMAGFVVAISKIYNVYDHSVQIKIENGKIRMKKASDAHSG